MQVVSRDIRRILTQRAHFFNIVLDDVSITNLTFSRDYTAAVESKQVAQQDAERAKFVVCLSDWKPELCRLGHQGLLGNLHTAGPLHWQHQSTWVQHDG